MKQLLLIASALAIATATSAATPAIASTMVLGESHGAACFNQAKGGHTDREALSVCNMALDGALVTRDRAATYVNRGIIHSNRGSFEAAYRDFDSAIRLNPALGEAYANRGTTMIRQARYGEALVQINKALEFDLAQPALVYFNRAVIHEEFDDLKKAYRDYRKASDQLPNWDLPKLELSRFNVETN